MFYPPLLQAAVLRISHPLLSSFRFIHRCKSRPPLLPTPIPPSPPPFTHATHDSMPRCFMAKKLKYPYQEWKQRQEPPDLPGELCVDLRTFSPGLRQARWALLTSSPSTKKKSRSLLTLVFSWKVCCWNTVFKFTKCQCTIRQQCWTDGQSQFTVYS